MSTDIKMSSFVWSIAELLRGDIFLEKFLFTDQLKRLQNAGFRH